MRFDIGVEGVGSRPHGGSDPVADGGVVRVEVGKVGHKADTGAAGFPVGVVAVDVPDDAAAGLRAAVAVSRVAVVGFPENEPGLVKRPEGLGDWREWRPAGRTAVEARAKRHIEHFHRMASGKWRVASGWGFWG